MPDLTFLGVLVVAVVGCLLYFKLRPARPPAPTCTDCDLEMVPLTELPTGTRFGGPRDSIYQCPRCGRRRQVEF